jgi:hypothetical protein
MTNASASGDFDTQNDVSNAKIQPINLSALRDDGLLLNTIFRYLSAKDLANLRRSSSYFHPQIQTFWYRFDTRQQIYYLTKYALEILAKKDRPFQLQQIKQALRDGALAIGGGSFEVSRTIAWLTGGLLSDTEAYPLPEIENPFLSAVLTLLYHQSRGNETLCQKSYHQALKQIGSMSKPMEPLLESLALSRFYKAGDLLNVFRCQSGKRGGKVFWWLRQVIASGEQKRVSSVINKIFLPCSKETNWQIRWSAVHLSIWIAKDSDGYQLKRVMKTLSLRLRDKNPSVYRATLIAWFKIAKNCDERQLKMQIACFKEVVGVRQSAIRLVKKTEKQHDKEGLLSLTIALPLFFKDKDDRLHEPDLRVVDKIANFRVKLQLANVAAALIFSLNNEKGCASDLAACSVDEIVKGCDDRQFINSIIVLFSRFQDRYTGVCQASVWIMGKIIKNCDKPGLANWATILPVRFKDDDQHVRQLSIRVASEVVKRCDKNQRAPLIAALFPCFQDNDYVRRAAIRAAGETAKYYDKKQLAGLITVILLCSQDERDYVSSAAFQEVGEIVNHFDKESFKNLITTLFCSFENYSGSRYSSRFKACDGVVGIAKCCDKQRFANIISLLLPCFKDEGWEGFVRQSAVLVALDILAFCDKSQIVQLITALILSCQDEERLVSLPALRGINKIVKYCDKCQFANLVTALLPCFEHHNEDIRREAVWSVPKIASYRDKQQFANLIIALLPCFKNEDWRVRAASVQTTGDVAQYCDKDQFAKLITAFLPGFEDSDIDVHTAIISSVVKMVKYCDREQFLALVVRLIADLSYGDDCNYKDDIHLHTVDYTRKDAAHALNEMVKQASSLQRKELMCLLIKDETIALKAIPIIKSIILLDRLSGITVNKALHQQLVRLKIIKSSRSVKQEKQDDFQAALDELKKNNAGIEIKKEVKDLCADLLSRSAALATIEKRPIFLMSFFLLKLEMFVRFSRLISSPSERKAIKEKAKTCATFFCRYHSRSRVIQVAKALPHQPFTCPKAIKTVINGYLPRRVYALRKRILPNPRYSREVSVARETLFSQSNKKRKARTTEPDNQLKVTAKRSRR